MEQQKSIMFPAPLSEQEIADLKANQERKQKQWAEEHARKAELREKIAKALGISVDELREVLR